MAGRNVRGGASLRKKLQAVEAMQRARYRCPTCGKTKVKRISFAQWECRSCNTKFAGGAYAPETLPGTTARRVVYGDS